MNICCFDDGRLGLIDNDSVIDISAVLTRLPGAQWPYPLGDAVIRNWAVLEPHLSGLIENAPRLELLNVRLNSPVGNPSKIIGIARNRKNLDQENLGPENDFAGGRRESDPMHMFIKANSALVGPSDGVALRFTGRRNDPEAELAIVMGKTGTDIAEEEALDYVFGYSIGLDMSLRGPEPASSRKSIDSYAVLGPWITTADDIADPDNLSTRLYVDGDILQEANTNMLAFGVRQIIANASSYFTLYPGDVIMAGTAASFAPHSPRFGHGRGVRGHRAHGHHRASARLN